MVDYIYGKFSKRKSELDNESGPRILVVDDNLCITEAMLEFFKLSLPMATVMTANSADEALQLFQPGTFDLVFMDWAMPGMNGIELTEILLAKDENIVVVMITGFPSVESAIRFFEAGGFYYLFKPFSIKEIIRIIQLALNTVFPSLFQKLRVLCDRSGDVLWNLQRISDRIQHVLTNTSRENDIGQSLIRHKMKQLVTDFVKTVRPGTDFQRNTNLLYIQSQSLARLADLTCHMTDGNFIAFLNQYTTDQQKRHGRLDLRLNVEAVTSEVTRSLTAETILSLITCELIDNAVAVLLGAGSIHVNVALLSSTQQLRIMV